MRQAFAGMLWSKQLYAYDVHRWLDGDPTPAGRHRPLGGPDATPAGRTSTPSTSCRCPTSGSTRGSPRGTSASTASPSPTSTRRSPSTSCCCSAGSGSSTRTAPCPPTSGTSATSTRRCRRGRRSRCSPSTAAATSTSSSRVFDKLLVNFTWWVNLEDADGNNLFEGGFLGLDNIGPIDRSHLPVGGTLEQSDATGWMAFYALAMAAHRHDPQPLRPAAGDRPRAQVPRALRRHPPGDGTVRRLGRRRRPLLRPARHARRHRRCRSRCARWSASSRCSPRSCSTRNSLDRAQTLGKGFARLLEELGGREGLDRAGARARRAGARARCCSASSAWTGWRRCCHACSTRTSSSRRTASGPCRRSTASTPTSSTSRASAPRSTTSRPSRPRRCSAATPTGGGRSGSR